jgi:HEAT repeat protein
VPAGEADVAVEYDRLVAGLESSLQRALAHWREEKDGDWDRKVPQLFRRILLLDDTDDTRAALAHASATWLVHMLDRHQLARAGKALELLDEVDPGHRRSREALARGLQTLDAAEMAEFLDEAEPAEQGRFAGLMVRLDEVATPFTFQVMGRATRGRTRAAAATALCYQCADHPERLQPFIDDPRLDVMLNLVFILGQIGGTGVVDMLRLAAQHPDPRVRRQAVLSLGGVPETERVPVLLDELARLDPHILGATLNLLARQSDQQASRFILGLIADPEFETRSEDVQRALFNALAEVAEDGAVPALEKLLNHNPGWLARRSFTQFAAALTLHRMGTPAARAALQTGLKSKHATVRSACADALKARVA